MGRIWVLEAYRQTLTLIRALSEAGEQPILGYARGKESGEFTAACLSSRHLSGSIPLPPVEDTQAFAAEVERQLQGEGAPDVVIPVGEASLLAVLGNEKRIRALRPLVAPPLSVVERCLDKAQANAVASGLGIDVPRTYEARNLGELELAVRATGYPCVVKPLDFTARGKGPKALLLRTGAEHRKLMPGWPEGATALLVQEFAAGHRHNCMFVARRGTVVARFESEVLRGDEPKGFGYGVESISVAPDAGRWRAVEGLVEKLGYDGPGCVQFLVEDGRFRFLEINPRFDASVALAWRSGVNLPAIAVAAVLGEGATRIALVGQDKSYAIGRRLHWLLGDVGGLLRALRERRVGLFSGAIWWARCQLAALRASVHMTWDYRDRSPSRVLLRAFFRSLKRALLGRWLK